MVKNEDDYTDRIAAALDQLRRQRPLVHCITNLVTINDVANALLAVGALPVMAHAVEEAADMVGAADALMLNIGTPTPDRVEAMLVAGRRANECGLPVVLDPVGVGATSFRDRVAEWLLDELAVTIVRGNGAEIAALAGQKAMIRGVEAWEPCETPADVAQALARQHKTVVALTGESDIVSDGQQNIVVQHGHRLLKSITGAGCMATAIIAAFAAVEDAPLVAAAGGLACFGLAAEQAATGARGPASFRVALLDSLYRLTSEEVQARIKGNCSACHSERSEESRLCEERDPPLRSR